MGYLSQFVINMYMYMYMYIVLLHVCAFSDRKHRAREYGIVWESSLSPELLPKDAGIPYIAGNFRRPKIRKMLKISLE